MGQKGAETRDRLLDATQELVDTAGYFGTGLNQVIAASGAPRGSLYFHFPGGKDQLVGESVRRAGQAIGDALSEPRRPTLTGGVHGVRRWGAAPPGRPARGVGLAQGMPGGDRGAGDGRRQRPAAGGVFGGLLLLGGSSARTAGEAGRTPTTSPSRSWPWWRVHSCWPGHIAAGTRWSASPAESTPCWADRGPPVDGGPSSCPKNM